MESPELLFQLSHQTLLDLVVRPEETVRYKDDDGLLATPDVNLCKQEIKRHGIPRNAAEVSVQSIWSVQAKQLLRVGDKADKFRYSLIKLFSTDAIKGRKTPTL